MSEQQIEFRTNEAVVTEMLVEKREELLEEDPTIQAALEETPVVEKPVVEVPPKPTESTQKKPNTPNKGNGNQNQNKQHAKPKSTVGVFSNTILRDKLNQLKKVHSFRSSNMQFPDITKIGVDGVGHIRIDRAGKTELGRILCIDFPWEFTHPVYGYFKSLHNFWVWLHRLDRDEQDTLRNADSAVLRTARSSAFVVNDSAIFAAVTWYCINTVENSVKQEIIKGITESTLPFDMYETTREGTPNKRTKFHESYLTTLEIIKKACVAGNEPNFNGLRFKDYLSIDESMALPPKPFKHNK